MLSLFSSVGICRILRYGSSNTSTVEQQVCPRFFSGPSKFGEMRRCERKMLKCNAELVDIVFRLMFETFWVAPYDLRRDFPVLVNFERHARHASVLLGKIDFASASGAQIYELGKTVAALDRAVRQIAEARLFSPVECAELVLVSGSVKATCAGQLPVTLCPDERLVAYRNSKKIDYQAVDANNYNKWMFETQKLDEMRLDAVFVNLEHRYNVEFDIADDVGLEARLTLSLRSEPLEEILDAIALVVPIRYESSGGTIFITRR